jgi:hypothetical protein
MSPEARAVQIAALVSGLVFALSAGVVAQEGPVAAMFNADQQRNASLSSSFSSIDVPATQAANFPLRVYLSAGDLERALDTADFRPDAVVVPTNTDLQIAAPAPATQQVLITRIRKQPAVLSDLESQIAKRQQQTSAANPGEPGVLRIGIDSFVARLANSAGTADKEGALPNAACLIATDFAKGGAVDRRELFAQDRVRRGVAACLEALDAAGARSLALPLMGAASSNVQRNDAQFEGQRALRECRLINSTAGIALGIHDFAARRRTLREIGVIQWDREITGMFDVDPASRQARLAQAAYRTYADQVKEAFRRGLAGQKTTAADLHGNCGAILDAK